ncbi:MAG TPA: hypothetical protein VFU21_19260 [Kofleriaceae bacterium]|nr:hypothetical protein [Kofleriaceae bacterium]
MPVLRRPLFAFTFALVACGGDDALEVPEGCQPLLGGHHCQLPYPSDFYRVEDGAAPGGFRLAPTGLVTNQDLDADVHGAVAADGFSHIPSIVALLPDEVSDAGLTHLLGDLAASTADDSRTLLLAADGTRVPHYVDLDPRAEDPRRQAIVIHPAVGLEYGQNYVVALRGIERPDGQPAAPAEGFRRLRDGEGDPAVDALAPRYDDDIFPRLEAQGWPRGELQLAWSFTVASREASVADMLRVRELTLAWLEENQPQVVIEEEELDPAPDVWKRVSGTVTGPLFLTADQPGALLHRGADGQVELNGTTSFEFTAQVPASLRDGGAGIALLYGHGFFGERDEIEGQSARTIADSLGAVLFAIDWAGMSTGDLPEVLQDLGGEPAHTVDFSDRVHQGIASWIAFSAAVRGPLTEAAELQRGGGAPVYSPAPLCFLGISQGHILGGTMTAVNPLVDRVALEVGGAGFTHMMFRARPFDAFLLIISGILDDFADHQLFAASLQIAFDRFDPASYAAYLSTEPLPGTPAGRGPLLQMGIGDASVPNLGTLLHARLLGAGYTAPSPLEPFALDALDGATSGPALTIFDLGVDPAAIYADAVPPAEDNPVHEGVRVEPTSIAQLRAFFTDGTIAHPCDGPCDPD